MNMVVVLPANAGICFAAFQEIPAFAGMTKNEVCA